MHESMTKGKGRTECGNDLEKRIKQEQEVEERTNEGGDNGERGGKVEVGEARQLEVAKQIGQNKLRCVRVCVVHICIRLFVYEGSMTDGKLMRTNSFTL